MGGIIPAYAGSTDCDCMPSIARQDHPRVCGEHPHMWHTTHKQKGSSPRMRGALRVSTRRRCLTRIIPAYAGSTNLPPALGGRGWDHPRVCGEHSRGQRVVRALGGSSPRMRGALLEGLRRCTRLRIIPAYAGSTSHALHHALIAWDHPRVCGEHRHMARKAQFVAGSSPRMRGAPPYGALVSSERGIIPAYAGSTDASDGRERGAGDHPRVCGEHPVCAPLRIESVGSSPRMRGAPERLRTRLTCSRIIPAYAGSTR